MIDLGSDLRQAREAKGVSLTEAEAATRIRQRYLQALETNDWAALPTQVQAQGFLRNYAVYLGLDADQVMSQYGQVIHSTIASPPPAPVSESAVRTEKGGAVFNPRDISIEGRGIGFPAWLSFDIIIGVVLALVVALVVYGLVNLDLFGGSSAPSTDQPKGTSVLAPAVDTGVPQPTAGSDPLLTDATPASATPTFNASTGNVQLTLEATEHVWVRVTVDDRVVLEGILAPGAPGTWQGTQQILLETANGAGLKVAVNGQSLEALGRRGEPVVLAWGPSGPLPPPPTTAP